MGNCASTPDTSSSEASRRGGGAARAAGGNSARSQPAGGIGGGGGSSSRNRERDHQQSQRQETSDLARRLARQARKQTAKDQAKAQAKALSAAGAAGSSGSSSVGASATAGTVSQSSYKGKGKQRSDSLPSLIPEDSIPMNTMNALRTYATVSHPSQALSAKVHLMSTSQIMAIFDAYPKAKYHFLVLPRYPFPSQSDPDSKSSIVKLEQLEDLRSLLLKTNRDVRDQIIQAMANMANEVEEMIRDEMVKTEGFEWKIDVGFHAIPSMRHVHLHVIAEDRVSDSLKTKKHYNSFRPDLGFFISIMDIQRWLQEDDEYIRERVNSLLATHDFLDSPLTCFKCDEPFHNMPKLKQHLEREFKKERSEALEQIKRTGRQGGVDDSMF